MKTDQHILETVGYCRKKWWLALVMITGCCAALIVFYLCCTSMHPHSFVTFALNKFGNQFSDNGNINNSQVNKSPVNNSQINDSQIKSSQMNETKYLTDMHNCSRYVSVGNLLSTGLGNQMFYFAAALHVADLTGRELVLFDNHNVRTLVAAFDLNVRMLKDVCPKYSFEESTYAFAFDARLEKFVLNYSETSDKSIYINGYFQSWRYIRLIEDRIRHHFNFRHDTRQVATKFLKRNTPPGWTTDFLRVGIHIRRGDFLQYEHVKFGFSVGTEAYFQKAMKYFVQKYGRTQFIAASTDKNWTTKFIYFNDSALSNVTFSFGHTHVQDMAILSMCDHVIVSTGTFGWWSGWLAGGTTIYYADYPRRNSSFSMKLKREDYYPTNWIPME